MESILFLTKANISTTSGQEMTLHLATVRKCVNRSFFITLDSNQIKTLYNFLWKTLDNIFKTGQPHIRIAASTTLGEILMTLGPYYHINLMKSLQDAIAFSTDESILLLSAFCYLSKFFSHSEISTILSETPIFHLFGVDESDHIVALVDGLLHLPVDFLMTLAEYLYMLAQKYPNNRHFPKAAAKLFNLDPKRFADIFEPSSLPLSLLSSMYPQKIPILPEEKREKLIVRCLKNLENNVKPPEIDYSCSVLISLYNSKQIESKRIDESVNENLLQNTQSLQSVLSLPISPQKAKCLFTFDPTATTKVGKFMCDYAKIPTLISFFAKCLINEKQIKEKCSQENENEKQQNEQQEKQKEQKDEKETEKQENEHQKKQNEQKDEEEKDQQEKDQQENVKEGGEIEKEKEEKDQQEKEIEKDEKSKIDENQERKQKYEENNGFHVFQEELLFLMKTALDPEKETYSNAIDAIPALENMEDKTPFYTILTQALDTVPITNWIQQFWLLKMLKRLNYSEIPLEILQKVFEAIERASISKSEKLQQEAKETTVEIAKTLQPIYYRLFVDVLIRKLDFFDPLTFEQKLSFIAYLFDKVPESYQISFLNVAYFLNECISAFDFNSECLTYSFQAVSPLVSHIKNVELVLFFVKHACNIIETSYNEFTGELIFPQKTQKFVIENNHSNVIK